MAYSPEFYFYELLIKYTTRFKLIIIRLKTKKRYIYSDKKSTLRALELSQNAAIN